MILIPDTVRPQLLANGRDPDADHVPLIKLFNPCGAATWLISEIQPYDEDVLFGLCDLGMGFPEIGPVSLSELQSVKGRLGWASSATCFSRGAIRSRSMPRPRPNRVGSPPSRLCWMPPPPGSPRIRTGACDGAIHHPIGIRGLLYAHPNRRRGFAHRSPPEGGRCLL